MSGCCTSAIDKIIILEKNVDRKQAIVGEVLTYSISVINQSSLGICDIKVIDALAPELEFVSGSIVLGDKELPDESVISGVSIGNLEAGAMKVITFKAKIIKRPGDGLLNNTAIAKFKCIVIDSGNEVAMNAISNTVTVKVEVAEINIVKQTDATIISRGDKIRYTVTLTNIGTIEAKNIFFKDIFPEQDNLCEETFEVNGQLTNVDINVIPNVGKEAQVYVGSLMPADEMVITYEMEVRSITCRGYTINKAYATFSYNLIDGCCGDKTSELDDDSMTEIELGLSTFKQISVDGYLPIPPAKPDIEEINHMTATADLINCHVIKTAVAKSNEGQMLSGYKLIIKGMLTLSVEYTANLREQSVHSAHYSVPFSTFIVLPDDYQVGSKFEVEFIVEDVYYKIIDIRTLFNNITVLVNMKILGC